MAAGVRPEKTAEVQAKQKLRERRAQPRFSGVVQFAERIEDADLAADRGLSLAREVVSKTESRRPTGPVGANERGRQARLLRGDEREAKRLLQLLRDRVGLEARSLPAIVAHDEPPRVARVEY